MRHVCSFAWLLKIDIWSFLSYYSWENRYDILSVFAFERLLKSIFKRNVALCRVRKARNAAPLSKSCDDIFNKLVQGGVPPDDLYETVCKQVSCWLLCFYFSKFLNNNHSSFYLSPSVQWRGESTIGFLGLTRRSYKSNGKFAKGMVVRMMGNMILFI